MRTGTQAYTTGIARWDIEVDASSSTMNEWEMIVGAAVGVDNTESYLSDGDTGFGYILVRPCCTA